MNQTMTILLERIRNRQKEIYRWLESHECSKELPLYSSVDIRDAGFKIAVVDTNLFPAGFNNLCEHGQDDSVKFIQQAIIKRVANAKNILIVAEEHTRNTWYLENIRILQQIIERAGFNVKIATFLNAQPNFCTEGAYTELETATKEIVKIYCFKGILEKYEKGLNPFDLIILNNDLIAGIPLVLKNSKVPIYPSIHAGWHSRLKSHHFAHTNDLIQDFAKLLDMDPWIFSCAFTAVDQVNINILEDREKIADLAKHLFEAIKEKYKEHQITEKPYIVLKADAGTYGMGVLPIEDPKKILQLNRDHRNELSKGKGSQAIERLLLQEGVPTIHNIERDVSEVCIYQIENNLIGGFYRSHPSKTDRENLNSKGMIFKKMCPHLPKYGECGVHHDISMFDVYRLLARIAGIAAHREIINLEATQK